MAAVGDEYVAHQRPWAWWSLADDMISLHDEIMRDDSTNESKLEELCDKWETAHGKLWLVEPASLVTLPYTARFQSDSVSDWCWGWVHGLSTRLRAGLSSVRVGL